MANDLEIKALAPTVLIVGGTATIDSDRPSSLKRLTLFGGSANTQIEFFNGSATTADLVYAANTIIATTFSDDFRPEGVPFTSKMFAKIEGTAGTAFVWYD